MPNILSFETAESILESEPEEQDYIVEQLIIKGAITSLTAKIKAGKTTFLGYLMRQVFAGESAMGFGTRPTKILYCTEEGKKTFRSFLKRSGLENCNGQLDVLFLGSVPRELKWHTVVEQILKHALAVNAFVVIFDTLTRWGHIKPEQENDAGAAALIMEPIEMLRAANIAVLGVFHERKSGGDISDASRGSSAFGGAADILLLLTNPETNGHPNRRQLKSVGRFDDPGEWYIDWDGGDYTLQGISPDIERAQLREKFAEVDEALTIKELGIRLGGSASTIRRMLDSLEAEGLVMVLGSGGRNDPRRYFPMIITTSRV